MSRCIRCAIAEQTVRHIVSVTNANPLQQRQRSLIARRVPQLRVQAQYAQFRNPGSNGDDSFYCPPTVVSLARCLYLSVCFCSHSVAVSRFISAVALCGCGCWCHQLSRQLCRSTHAQARTAGTPKSGAPNLRPQVVAVGSRVRMRLCLQSAPQATTANAT